MKKLTQITQFTFALLVFFALAGLTNQAAAQGNLVYGQAYNIQNGWNNSQGGFLNTAGRNCYGNYLCVSTSKIANRGESGLWVILSATGKAEGTAVAANDLVILKNMFSGDGGNGGYLGTRFHAKDYNLPGYLGVSTFKDLDTGGNTTWKITGANGGMVKDNAPINLEGQWNADGGYLDTNGYSKDYSSCKGNYICVSTSRESNRSLGSGHWSFIKVEAPIKITIPGKSVSGYFTTNITVEPGDKLTFKATGQCSPRYENLMGGPDGDPSLKSNPKYLDPTLTPLALIGKIGEGGEWFLIGSSMEMVATTGGQLILGYNDTYWVDNAGFFDVMISVK